MEHFAIEPVSVSEAVRGMVLSDTLWGASNGRRSGHGPLGRLAASVRGGNVDDVDAEALAAVKGEVGSAGSSWPAVHTVRR